MLGRCLAQCLRTRRADEVPGETVSRQNPGCQQCQWAMTVGMSMRRSVLEGAERRVAFKRLAQRLGTRSADGVDSEAANEGWIRVSMGADTFGLEFRL